MANISLGLQTRDGFDDADLSSPAQAAAAGALLDQRWDDEPELPMELRVHGVSGSTGPVILGHPDVLRVGGQKPTAFYRRWSPDGAGRPTVPWPLEAYSWGGLTERPLVSASWVLLAPFMFYNIAYFMLPAGPVDAEGRDRSRVQPVARALVRLLALAATLQFVGGLLVLFVSTLGWQDPVRRFGSTWWWLNWLTGAGAPTRLGYGLAAVGLIIAALWRASITTVDHYESFTDVPPSGTAEGVTGTPASRTSGRLSTLRLRKRGFWHGAAAAVRQRNTHVSAAFAFATLVVSSAAVRPGGWQNAERLIAATILGLAVLLTVFSTDRDALTGDGEGNTAPYRPAFAYLTRFSAALLAATAISAHWVLQVPAVAPARSVPPRLLGTATTLMMVQFGLLIVFAVAVVWLRVTSAHDEADGWKPFLRGCSAPVLTLLAVMLGGALSAAINIGVARIFAEPSGIGLAQNNPSITRAHPQLFLPDQTFAYASGMAVAAVAVLGISAGLMLRYRSLRRGFAGPATTPSLSTAKSTPTAKSTSTVPTSFAPPAAEPTTTGVHPGPDRVRDWYPRSESTGPHPASQEDVDQVAGSWAVAALTDLIAVIIAVLALSWATGMIAVEGFTLIHGWQRFTSWVNVLANGVVTFGVLVGAVLAIIGVLLLRSEYNSPTGRKTIGALWDIGTFWPRATHPLAPPCYAEQAVPEVVERIRLLTGEPLPWVQPEQPQAEPDQKEGRQGTPSGPGRTPFTRPRRVLLTGYSQGTIISAAVVAQLPERALAEVSLLTLACPLRRLYGRAFPAYFGPKETDALAQLLRVTPPGQPESPRPRWRNLVRHTDYIGGWVFAPPVPRSDPATSVDLDGLSLDPPSLIPGPGRGLAQTHYHSAWWQDPLTIDYARILIRPAERVEHGRRVRIGWRHRWPGTGARTSR